MEAPQESSTSLAARPRLLVTPRGLAAPLLVWGLAAAAVAGTAAAFGYDPLDSGTWSRSDSGLYAQIARDGYDLFPCRPPYAPGTWCGDAGWFPAYSWLVGGLHRIGLPLMGTAVVVSWTFAAATIVLLWSTFFGRRLRAAAVGGLLYAAFAPGQIYDYAIFPLSILAFWTIAYLWLLHRGRWAAAGISGAIAALSYPAGVVLAPVSAAWLLAQRSVAPVERLRRTAWASGLIVAALGLFALDQRLETGHWDAYLLVQDKYHHTLQNPFAATHGLILPLQHGSPFVLSKAPALQTVVVTFALLAVLAHAVARRRSLDRLDVLLLLWAIATWVFPLMQANLSVQRSQAALLPLALLAQRLPKPLLFTLVAVAAAVALAMEKLFLQGVLV